MSDDARAQLYELCSAVQDFIKEQAQKGRYFSARIDLEEITLYDLLPQADNKSS